MWARILAMGSRWLPPSTVRAAWGVAVPLLAVSYSLHGAFLATRPRDGFGLWMRTAPHLTLWVFAGLVGLGVVGIARWTGWERSWFGRAVAALAVSASVAGAAVASSRPSYPPAAAFITSLDNALHDQSPDPGVSRVPAPFGVDQTFLIRPDMEPDDRRRFELDDGHVLTFEPSFQREWVDVQLDGERAVVRPHIDWVDVAVLHRIGPHWIFVSHRDRPRHEVIAGPRRGGDLGVVDVFPGRVGCEEPIAWSLTASVPLALLCFVWAELQRRRLRLMTSGVAAVALRDADGVVRSARRRDGQVVRLTTPVPPTTHTLFLDVTRTDETYREEARPNGRVVRASALDAETTLALARTRIARLDALCVLVVLLLTAPAVGAHLRGLTVSLPFARTTLQ